MAQWRTLGLSELALDARAAELGRFNARVAAGLAQHCPESAGWELASIEFESCKGEDTGTVPAARHTALRADLHGVFVYAEAADSGAGSVSVLVGEVTPIRSLAFKLVSGAFFMGVLAGVVIGFGHHLVEGTRLRDAIVTGLLIGVVLIGVPLSAIAIAVTAPLRAWAARKVRSDVAAVAAMVDDVATELQSASREVSWTRNASPAIAYLPFVLAFGGAAGYCLWVGMAAGFSMQSMIWWVGAFALGLVAVALTGVYYVASNVGFPE